MADPPRQDDHANKDGALAQTHVDDELEPTLRDTDGNPEAVYLTRTAARTTDQGWWITSLDVETWRPLEVGDRVIAADRDSPDEFIVEVVDIHILGEVFYFLKHLADLDPAAEPGLANTRAADSPEETP